MSSAGPGTIFGKRISEYLSFQKVVLALLAAVGLTRLVLSLAGVPANVVVWFSMNLVVWAGAVYYGIAAHRRAFGSYKQLLPLLFFQSVVFHAIAVLGILLTIGGLPNIYAAPEYSGPAASNQWLHALAHLTIGMIATTLILWGVACLAMLISRKVAPRPAAAAA